MSSQITKPPFPSCLHCSIRRFLFYFLIWTTGRWKVVIREMFAHTYDGYDIYTTVRPCINITCFISGDVTRQRNLTDTNCDTSLWNVPRSSLKYSKRF